MTWVRFLQNKEPIKIVKFPVTDLGNSTTVTFEAHNPTDSPLSLTPNEITDNGLTIEQFPKTLEAGQSGLVILRFSAPQDREKPLQTGILFREVLG